MAGRGNYWGKGEGRAPKHFLLTGYLLIPSLPERCYISGCSRGLVRMTANGVASHPTSPRHGSVLRSLGLGLGLGLPRKARWEGRALLGPTCTNVVSLFCAQRTGLTSDSQVTHEVDRLTDQLMSTLLPLLSLHPLFPRPDQVSRPGSRSPLANHRPRSPTRCQKRSSTTITDQSTTRMSKASLHDSLSFLWCDAVLVDLISFPLPHELTPSCFRHDTLLGR